MEPNSTQYQKSPGVHVPRFSLSETKCYQSHHRHTSFNALLVLWWQFFRVFGGYVVS
jgi:hypothetical protein